MLENPELRLLNGWKKYKAVSNLVPKVVLRPIAVVKNARIVECCTRFESYAW